MTDAGRGEIALNDQRWRFLSKNDAGGEAAEGDYPQDPVHWKGTKLTNSNTTAAYSG